MPLPGSDDRAVVEPVAEAGEAVPDGRASGTTRHGPSDAEVWA
ncbi:hypothetical protein [Streptomyces sp. NRRL B-1347]|nr:hypothetical protein [Streptomyces sp. NRRL B-1347]